MRKTWLFVIVLITLPNLLRIAAKPATPHPERTRRYLLDNDGNNLFRRLTLDAEELRWEVEQCPAAITTYLICPNWRGKFFYPCKVGEPAPDEIAPTFWETVRRGGDPLGDFIAKLKATGREVFITYRMNDVHNATDPDNPGRSLFKSQHLEWIVDADIPVENRRWMSYCLDYNQPEVRAYYLASLRDLAQRYDVDGFQLDWMRFPRHLKGKSPEEIWAKRDALTQFVASTRTMLDEIGRQRNKRILLAVRIPTTPEGCRNLGCDLPQWTQKRLVDFITAAPFLTTDFVIPFQAFREWIGSQSMPIYAGADMNHGGRIHTPESYRGWALSMHDQGADGLNVFNVPCYAERIDESPYYWVADLNDPQKLTRQPTLYTLPSNIHRVAGIDQTAPLPITLEPGQSAERSLHLPAAALPASHARLLIAADGVGLQPTVNGQKLARPRSKRPPNIFPPFLTERVIPREPAKDHGHVYRLSPQILRSGPNILSFTNASDSKLTIERVDLGFWYNE